MTSHISKQIGTNWFTVVMGFGIMASLFYASPVNFAFHQSLGIIFFALDLAIFVAALFFWGLRWVHHTKDAIGDFHEPGRALFYGALAMAINVVGNDFFVIGSHLFNKAHMITVSQIFWIIGVAVSLFSVLIIPYLMFTHHDIEPGDAVASWLIPVVPTVVAAADGTNLLPYWGNASVNLGMTYFDISMFGMTFFLFIMVSALFYSRLMYHRIIPGALAPSVWIEIGPIGMSMATLATLPFVTADLLPRFTSGLLGIGLIAGSALWGVGIWWSLIAMFYSLLHVRGKKKEGIPYSLGWWSYVFPLGSFTAGTYAMYHLTGSHFFMWAGGIQLLVLTGFFVMVSYMTFRGVVKGTLITRHPARRGIFVSHSVVQED